MARIVLIAAVFFMTFSHHLMAAEAQLKKPAPAKNDECSEALKQCKTSWETANKSNSAQDYSGCTSVCKKAMNACIKKGSQDPHYTTAHAHNLSCRTTPLKKINSQKINSEKK